MEANYTNIEAIASIYRQVKTSIAYEAFYGIIATLVIVLTLKKAWDEYQKHFGSAENIPDMAAIWGQLKNYLIAVMVIAILPLIFTGIESLFAEMQDKLITGLGGDVSAYDQMDKMMRDENDNTVWDSLDGALLATSPSGIISTLLNYIISPICVVIFKFTYTAFIAGRFMYLLLLETIAPVAIICILHESTRQYFHSWVKYLFLCYLLLPFFLMANLFGNELGIWMIGGKLITAAWINVILATWFKLKLFKVVSTKVSQLF